MNTIAMKVNTEKLVQSLKFSFSNRSTVLGELMQNARRAGASVVKFNFDAASQTLTVLDDGCGIEDIAALLTVAESGWDEGLMRDEHPFGMGFISALYACEHLTLVSRCGRLSALTADILSFKDLAVDKSVDWQGQTTLTLTGFDLEAHVIENKLKALAEGFGIPVLFNGVALERHAAFDVSTGSSPSGLEFVETEVGWVCLRGNRFDSKIPLASDYFKVYLQGLPVYTSSFGGNRDNLHIIHLDSARFFARLPDRDKLIDETEVVSLLREVLKQLARQRFTALKAKMAPEAFVETFDALSNWECKDLLNDVDYLPTRAVERITGYPNCASELFGDFMAYPAQPVSHSAIAAGQVEVVTIDDDLKEDGAQCYMFAWLRDSLIYRDNLDAGHWLHPMLRHLNQETVRVELINENHSVGFQGNWVWLHVTFCEAYRITIGNDVVLVTDLAYYKGDEARETVIVPSGDRSADVIAQVSTFQSEYDDFQQSTYQDECTAFRAFVIANTTDDPTVALQQLLPDLSGCPSLFGKAFAIRLDDHGKVVSVLAA